MSAVSTRLPESGEAIKILIIDDNPSDVELSLMELHRAHIRTESVFVSNENQLRTVLHVFAPDVVLCDFSMPGFDGLAAQGIVRECRPEAPVIFVSGVISEERAAMALQSGAVDYVMKTSLARLPNAVTRAIATARLTAESELRTRQHAGRLETLWQIANNPTLTGQELVMAMLSQAAAAIGPENFRGLLCRIDHDGFVVVAEGGESNDALRVSLLEFVARRKSSEAAPPVRLRSHGWDGMTPESSLPDAFADLGWRAVICTQFVVGGASYWLTFASSQRKRIPFGEPDFAYLDVLAGSFANQIHMNALEDSLRDQEMRAREHGQRLEALWAIVNDSSLGDAEKWLAMLAQAAAAISPGQGFRATLWRIDGENMILEASGDSPGHGLPPLVLEGGNIMPISQSVVQIVLAKGGGTQTWDDIRTSAYSEKGKRTRGARTYAVTTFAAGGATWALSFASGNVTAKPLGRLEMAYIEVLASFFSNHVQQRWQFERIQYQQSHDVLTGLFNRSTFRSQARVLAASGPRYAIILVDINDFHEINESYGHNIGDAVLVEVGGALQACAFHEEIVGRIGGDVFAVYVPAPAYDGYVLARARCFADIFAHAFSTGDRDGKEFIARNASIGLAAAPEHGQTLDAILAHADAALAAAKSLGHGSIVSYEAGMEGDAQRRADFRNELVGAVARDEFTLYYQPHVESATGDVTGCEALIRWKHPQRGLIMPGDFIPFAEQTGLITSIDDWVMRNAFAAAAELSALRPGFRLYFNLSARQAGDPNLVRAFVAAARTGVSLANIGVEITETDAMRDVATTRRVLRALRRLNVRVAIDDFGTGYSSLSTLKQLPIDVVKIDRSFTSGVTNNRHDAAIAQTIISIAEHFGFESLGEGAEVPEDVEWLREHHCRYVQGYAVCYPLPIGEFKAWVNLRA